MPSLLLDNLPEISVEALRESFSDFKPLSVSFSGGTTFQVNKILSIQLCNMNIDAYTHRYVFCRSMCPRQAMH